MHLDTALESNDPGSEVSHDPRSMDTERAAGSAGHAIDTNVLSPRETSGPIQLEVLEPRNEPPVGPFEPIQNHLLQNHPDFRGFGWFWGISRPASHDRHHENNQPS